MRVGHLGTAAALAMLAACNQPQPQNTTVEANVAIPEASGPSAPEPAPAAPTAPQPPTPPPPPAPPVAANVAEANAAEPAAPDYKSVDAALDVARQFADLVSARKFDQAYALLGGRGGFASVADFRRHFAPYSDLSLTILDSPPPDPEGAAGSIYLSVQAQMSGMDAGRRVHHPATITLRRVNDVPGSTEAQRHWHVEGFDDTVK